jgi:PIN domain nuclease of toxin-antitoxin system
MRLLLDTHVFLWFISGDKQLKQAVKDIIRNPGNEAYLSVVSLWEAIVKNQIGKLPLPSPAETYLPEQRERHLISSLTLDEASISQLAKLPSIHRDPFDRMLICQAIEHNLTIVTADKVFHSYPVAVLDGI